MGTIAEKLTYTANAVEDIYDRMEAKTGRSLASIELADIPGFITDLNVPDWNSITMLGRLQTTSTDFNYIPLSDAYDRYSLLVFIVGINANPFPDSRQFYNNSANNQIVAISDPNILKVNSITTHQLWANLSTNVLEAIDINITAVPGLVNAINWKKSSTRNLAMSVFGVGRK